MNGNGHEPQERPYLDCEVNDEGNAECLFKTVGQEFRYCDAYGWLYWNGRYWKREGAQEKLEHAVVKMLRARIAEGNRNRRDDIVKSCIPKRDTVGAVISMFRKHVYSDAGDFDSNPFTLNCMNGEIDLRSGTLKAHDPSMLYTYCVNAEYDPHADTTEWETWLETVVDGGTEMVRFLQVLCGYSFTGLTPEEMFVYLWGPTRSGKGTFTETLLELAGYPLGVEAMMSTFTEKRSGGDQNFDLAPLKAARLVIASETESNDWLSPAKIKTMTGGNAITCAFKHKDQFTYRPAYLIWLVSNHPIQTDADDTGMWGRARVITFPHSHLGKEDKTLKRRMKQSDNLKAVLNWIVWGSVEYFANGLRVPEIVQVQTKKARDSVDFVGQWLADNVTLGNPSDFTAATVLYQNYEDWCKDMGVPPKKQRSLSNSLQARGVSMSVPHRTPLGVQRVHFGVKIGKELEAV